MQNNEILDYCQKMGSKWIINLNIRSKTRIISIRKNRRKYFLPQVWQRFPRTHANKA